MNQIGLIRPGLSSGALAMDVHVSHVLATSMVSGHLLALPQVVQERPHA